jgi:hypothetical protein
MIRVLVACPDLMTSSRFSGEGIDVVVAGRIEKVWATFEQGVDVVLIDLPSFPELAEQMRGRVGAEGPAILGFAPHVHEGLLEAAKAWCDRVYPRGAIVSGFERIIGKHAAAKASASGDIVEP